MKRQQGVKKRYFFFSFAHSCGLGNGAYSAATFPSIAELNRFIARERPGSRGVAILSIQEIEYRDYFSLLAGRDAS